MLVVYLAQIMHFEFIFKIRNLVRYVIRGKAGELMVYLIFLTMFVKFLSHDFFSSAPPQFFWPICADFYHQWLCKCIKQ